MASVRIQLPTEFPDTRATVFRVYRRSESVPQPALVAEVPIGTTDIVDGLADFGTYYFYTAKDTSSGNESPGSKLSYVFRRRSTMPGIF